MLRVAQSKMLTNQENAELNHLIGFAARIASCSGASRAATLGTCSPSTTCKLVTMIRENTKGSAVRNGSIRLHWTGISREWKMGSSKASKVFSPTAPRARLAMVMPSWAAAINRSRARGLSNQIRTCWAAVFPSSACKRTRLLRAVITANSVATKKPFKATRKRINKKFQIIGFYPEI